MIRDAKSALSLRASVGAKMSLCAAHTSAALRASKSFVSALTSSYWKTEGAREHSRL